MVPYPEMGVVATGKCVALHRSQPDVEFKIIADSLIRSQIAKTMKSKSKPQSHPVTAAEVAQIARRISMRQAASKHFYVNSGTTSTNFLAAGALFPLSQVATGTSDSTRVGDEIRAKHLRLNFRFVGQTSNLATMIRLVIFRWKPLASASIPAIATVFYESMAQDYQSCMSALDPKNVPSQAIIIRDKTIYTTAPYVNNPPSETLFEIPLDFPMVFTGETYSTNALYAVIVNMGSASASTYNYNSQITYTDQ